MTCTMEEVKLRDLKEEYAEILVDLFKKPIEKIMRKIIVI